MNMNTGRRKSSKRWTNKLLKFGYERGQQTESVKLKKICHASSFLFNS